MTQGEDYRRIVRRGRRVAGTFLVTHAVFSCSDAPMRFGYIVSKRVGGAVVRNLVRRRLQGISRELLHAGYSGADVVFRVQPSAATANYGELKREATEHIDRLVNLASTSATKE